MPYFIIPYKICTIQENLRNLFIKSPIPAPTDTSSPSPSLLTLIKPLTLADTQIHSRVSSRAIRRFLEKSQRSN